MQVQTSTKRLTLGQWPSLAAFFFRRFFELETAVNELNSALLAVAPMNSSEPRLLASASPNWLNQALEKRIDKVIARLIKLDLSMPSQRWGDLHRCLDQAKLQVAVRNTLAHGFLAQDCSMEGHGGYVMISRAVRSRSGELVEKGKLVSCHDVQAGANRLLEIEAQLSLSFKVMLKEGLFEDKRHRASDLPWEMNFHASELCMSMGRFFISMGSIEMLIRDIYQFVLGKASYGAGLEPKSVCGEPIDSLSLAETCADLMKALPCDEAFMPLRRVIAEITQGELIEERNMLTHAGVRYVQQSDGELALMAVRCTRKGGQYRSEQQIRASIMRSIRLSDDLSEAIARSPRIR